MFSWLALLALGAPAHALSADLVGRPAPQLSGRNLNGDPRALPADFKGKPGVVVAGFSLGSREDATTWATKIAHAYASKGRVDAYVAVVVEAPAFIEPLVAAAMRAGQPADIHKWGMTVMDPDKALRASLGVVDDTKAQVLLVAPDGRLKWATGDGFTAARWAAFEAAVAQVAAPARGK